MNTVTIFEDGSGTTDRDTFTFITLSHCSAEMKEMQPQSLFSKNLNASMGILMWIKTQSKFAVWRRNCTGANLCSQIPNFKVCVCMYTSQLTFDVYTACCISTQKISIWKLSLHLNSTFSYVTIGTAVASYKETKKEKMMPLSY